jgi:predicted phage terminase large subunit-like protein
MLGKSLKPRLTKYIPIYPTPRQTAFLLAPQREVLYGGAAGGGKSFGLLMGALQHVDIPGYSAGIFRRTFQDLALPGALMALSKEWLMNTDASWNAERYVWTFPSGATIMFGYLKSIDDKFRYQGSRFHYIAFDELTQFEAEQYLYLFSRNRREDHETTNSPAAQIPLRMRAATNPGGVGHEWVKKRFIGTARKPVRKKSRLFIPAFLSDNPYLDQHSYRESLEELDIVTKAQLLRGDWEADARGGMFKPHWFNISEDPPHRFSYLIRYWDMAGTSARRGRSPDYTVGTKLGLDQQGTYWVLDVRRFREEPPDTERLIYETAIADGPGVDIFMERQPGSAGKGEISNYARNVLPGFAFRQHQTTGDKSIRAKPVSTAAENGLVSILYAEWNESFLDELSLFPDGSFDDQVDSLSGAFDVIFRRVQVAKRGQGKQTSRFASRRR